MFLEHSTWQLRLLWTLKESIIPFLWMNICSHWQHCSLGLSLGPVHLYNDDFGFMQRIVLLAQAAQEADYHFCRSQISHRILWHLAECHVMGTNNPLAHLWRRARCFPSAGLQSQPVWSYYFGWGMGKTRSKSGEKDWGRWKIVLCSQSPHIT